MLKSEFPVRKIREGSTSLFVPNVEFPPGASVFFNPKMEFDRDLGVLILNSIEKMKDLYICEPLTGCGARGIRYANELKNVNECVINDVNPEASKLAEKNVRLNKLQEKVSVYNLDANFLILKLLHENERKFNVIDLDPSGSPIYYVNSVARAIKNNGLVAFTATDTAPLAGINPLTCLRRYGIESYKTDFFKELGLRILITSAVLSFSKWSFFLKSLLSYASEHYLRVFASVKKGKSIASKTIKENLGYVNYCPECLWRSVDVNPITECEFCEKKTKIIGRVWVGQIEDLGFIRFCEEELSRIGWLKTGNRIKKLLHLLKNEPFPFYYDVHKVCQKHGLRIPNFKILQEKLRENGYKAERTHFSNVGIKTDAPLKDLIKVISGCY
ncbi:MAG: tRNA (guanine(10)-N(2))-dimethyltransferase [Candidatus Aenigmarchaeota archaeon]|nr:tRNA (guanine(10)-N(2))-dimethyltransferase [Candidatus Aenigmarchaeota archaeon]